MTKNRKNIPHHLISTANEIAGLEIVKNLGICGSQVVFNLAKVTNFTVMRENLHGGRSKTVEDVFKQSKTDAYCELVDQAVEMGANALIGFR